MNLSHKLHKHEWMSSMWRQQIFYLDLFWNERYQEPGQRQRSKITIVKEKKESYPLNISHRLNQAKTTISTWRYQSQVTHISICPEESNCLESIKTSHSVSYRWKIINQLKKKFSTRLSHSFTFFNEVQLLWNEMFGSRHRSSFTNRVGEQLWWFMHQSCGTPFPLL